MIKWREEFRLGIDSIDEQHIRLFEIANEAYDLLKADYYIDKYDKIVALLKELKDYTIYHFSSEEEYMKSIGYKKFFSHKVEHNDFIDKINSIDLDKIDENQDQYIVEILNFVVDWIEQHILGTDKQIVA